MKPVALYTLCIACDGHGRVPAHPDGPRTSLCPECRGTGFAPTPEGRAIVGLVRAAKLDEILPEAGV